MAYARAQVRHARASGRGGIMVPRMLATLTSFRTALCLLVGVVFVLVGLQIQHDFYSAGMEYYLVLAQGGDAAAHALANCELEGVFAEISRRGTGNVRVGPCDVVLVSGLVAAAGFLSFLFFYVASVALTWFLIRPLPASWRPWVVAAMSVVFLFVALPARAACWFLEFGVVLAALAAAPVPRRVRAALLVGASVVFYLVVGKAILVLCQDEFFHAYRLYVEGGISPRSSLGEFLEFLNLGNPSFKREGEGFPYLLPALGLLITLPRRIAWLTYELWVGRTEVVGGLTGFLYLLGLPFLIGNAASPSFDEFHRSYGRKGADGGGRTLAWCLGFGTLGYVFLLGMGYSPAVRLLFARCDVDLVPVLWVWARLVTMFVISYLYLLSTEQMSVASCRLMGFAVGDNYDRPLMARNVAEFWRRWNILWRGFLVSVFFFPVAMALARRAGRPRDWHLVVATAATFLGTLVLNVLPLALLSAGGMKRFVTADAARPGPGLTESVHLDPSMGLMDLLPALCVYYTLEGGAVAWNLYAEASGRAGRLPRWAAWLLTFLFLALARVFVDPSLKLNEKLDLIQRALGF